MTTINSEPFSEDYIEPKEHERKFYRHSKTGDLGYLIKNKQGVPYMRYDRVNNVKAVRYSEMDWIEEDEHRPIPDMHLVRVAFEADRALCLILGIHTQAKKEWLDLTDSDKIAWQRKGPSRPVIRRKLYLLIMDVLRSMQ